MVWKSNLLAAHDRIRLLAISQTYWPRLERKKENAKTRRNSPSEQRRSFFLVRSWLIDSLRIWYFLPIRFEAAKVDVVDWRSDRKREREIWGSRRRKYCFVELWRERKKDGFVSRVREPDWRWIASRLGCWEKRRANFLGPAIIFLFLRLIRLLLL